MNKSMNKSISRRSLLAGMVGLGALVATGLAGCHPQGDVKPPRETEGIAISLKTLASVASDPALHGSIPDEILKLAGITEVVGYLIDKEHSDVVLIGRKREGAPALYLDDLVAALKNVFMKYAETKGNTIYYSAPMVSLDPDPATLMALKPIQERMFQPDVFQNPKLRDRMVEEWYRVARGPQKTRVLGMPPVRMMGCALRADYDMKKIVDGSEKIEGVTSLSALIEQENAHANPLNRFWFVAKPDPSFIEGDGIIMIKSSPVSLLTEAEALVDHTTISGRGKPDPTAQKFCKGFNAHFPQIARREIYAELVSGFRWMGIATLMKQNNVFDKSGMAPNFYLNNYIPGTVKIPATLPGIAHIKAPEKAAAPGETERWMMTVGGVNLGVKVRDVNIERDTWGHLREVEQKVAETRPKSTEFWWRFRSNSLARYGNI